MVDDLDFPSLNRALVTIECRQPFVDWINSTREKEQYKNGSIFELDQINEEPVAYLIPEMLNMNDFDLFLEMNWGMLFEMQLSGWILDEKLWPKKRTKKMFKEWFNIKCSSLVIDLWDKEPLNYQGEEEEG